MYHYRQTSLSLPQARDPSCVSNAMDSQPGYFCIGSAIGQGLAGAAAGKHGEVVFRSNWGPGAGSVFPHPNLASCAGGSGLGSQHQERAGAWWVMESWPLRSARLSSAALVGLDSMPASLDVHQVMLSCLPELWAEGRDSWTACVSPLLRVPDSRSAHPSKAAQDLQDSNTGNPSVRMWNVNDIQEANPGMREIVLEIPSACGDSEFLWCIIYVCFCQKVRLDGFWGVSSIPRVFIAETQGLLAAPLFRYNVYSCMFHIQHMLLIICTDHCSHLSE